VYKTNLAVTSGVDGRQPDCTRRTQVRAGRYLYMHCTLSANTDELLACIQSAKFIAGIG
jgi:hypothetical protein